MRTCDSLQSLRTTQIQQATCDTIGSRPSGTRTSARATRSTTCSSRMGSRGCCGSHVVSHVPCCALYDAYDAWLIRIRSAPISATPDVRQPPHSPHTHAQHTHARTRYAHGTDEVARAHAPHMCLGVVHAVNGASICRRARIAHALLLLLRALCLAQGCMADGSGSSARSQHGRDRHLCAHRRNVRQSGAYPMGTADTACAQQPPSDINARR